MRNKDTSDVLTSCAAIAGDALFIFAGFMAALWIRFDSGLVPLFHDSLPPNLYSSYGKGAGLATLLFLFIFQALKLYQRPQVGTFADKIPRLIHACALGMIMTLAMAFAIRTDPPFSRFYVLISAFSVLLFVLVERYLLFRVELALARGKTVVNRVLIAGADHLAAHLKRAIDQEPRLKSKVVGFLTTDSNPPHPDVPTEMIMGSLDDLKQLLEAGIADRLIVADSAIGHDKIVEIILLCEQSLIAFNLVPDLFHILTGNVDMQMIDDIPLLGVSRWPLDNFWNRIVKRAEDVCGALIGLLIFSPLMLTVAILIRRDSPGPVFYRQERCGESGRLFMLIKFRTMRQDAEAGGAAAWTVENDPRRTRVGAFLRRNNIDELPQLWNVLKGEMSMVGPRPERPHFVEQFKEDINRYMWRHVSKPGMTGWAQVNGLRGNTDIRERIKYDLYYLEHWSLAFDFKIIMRTFFSHKNAY